MGAIRNAAVAGMFYPAEPEELAHEIRQFLGAIQPSSAPAPKAVIAPHAGYIYSGPIAASAYARIAALRHVISRVVLIGPSHRVAFRGLAVPSAEAFRTPLGTVPVDRPAVAELLKLAEVGVLDAAHAQEHSLEVHLPFLQTLLDRFALVPIVAGDASPEEVAKVLDAVWGGPETLVVVSSDLSHYLDYQSAQRLDDETRTAIEGLDPAAIAYEQACGRIPIGGLLTIAKRRGLSVETVDMRNSGDTAGPRDRVVGYGAWVFTPASPGESAGDDVEAPIREQGPTLVRLARAAIEAALDGGRLVLPDDPPELLKSPGASFVTLKIDGALRGCIGSVEAWRPLMADVTDNAVKAAFGDPRFPPLTGNEAENLTISVTVLSPPQPLAFADETDLLTKLRPRVDGLIIEDAGHRALFLPAVWDMLPNPEEFLAYLKNKAGLAPQHERFTAKRFTAVELKDG